MPTPPPPPKKTTKQNKTLPFFPHVFNRYSFRRVCFVDIYLTNAKHSTCFFFIHISPPSRVKSKIVTFIPSLLHLSAFCCCLDFVNLNQNLMFDLSPLFYTRSGNLRIANQLGKIERTTPRSPHHISQGNVYMCLFVNVRKNKFSIM